MKRRIFFIAAGGTVLATAGAYYFLSDKSNFTRNDIKTASPEKFSFKPDEKEILYLASLAPSGHNTQPWSVNTLSPIIG